MSTIDPTPRTHLPPPVRVPPGHFLTLVLDPADAITIQSVLRERNRWIEPIEGTEHDTDPVYGIMPPSTGRR